MIFQSVIPAQARIHFNRKFLDSRLLGNDGSRGAMLEARSPMTTAPAPMPAAGAARDAMSLAGALRHA